jgi:archaellum component FlaC
MLMSAQTLPAISQHVKLHDMYYTRAMSLSNGELSQVSDVIVHAIETLVIPRFDEIDERFNKVDERFEGVEQRIDRLEQRFDALEQRFDRLEQRIDALAEDTRALKAAMHEVRERLATIEGRLEKVEGRLEALEADIKELYGIVAKFQRQGNVRKGFEKLSFDEKIIQVYKDIVALAQEADIPLPH